MIRSHILLFTAVIAFALCSSPYSSAQESKDNDPHIKPRDSAAPPPARPTATPVQKQRLPSLDEVEAEAGESSSKDAQIDLNMRAPSRDRSGKPDDTEGGVFDPHRAMKDIEVGNYYLKLKNYRAALDRYHDALLYKPGDAEATYGLAVVQEKLSLPTQAYKNYKQYLEILPSGPTAKEAKEAVKRLAPFVDAATASSELAKESARLMEAGEGFLANNKYDDALEQFENALRLTPDNPVIHFRIGQSLRGMERLDPARLHFQKYLEAQPNGPFAADAKKAVSDINYIMGK